MKSKLVLDVLVEGSTLKFVQHVCCKSYSTRDKLTSKALLVHR